MNDLVTIKTFTYPTEMAVLKGKLESEGIECFVKDELTIQVDNFYSNALGGVKLQVRESDVPLALEIMKEGGYITEKDFEPSQFWIKLDGLTSSIPLLKSLRVELRVLIIAAVFFTLIFSIWYLIMMHSFSMMGDRFPNRS